jgi:hypothetical protein
MQELALGVCPLHSDELVRSCAWCGLHDRVKVQQQIHDLLLDKLVAADAPAVLVSMTLLGRVGAALAVDATVSVVGRSLRVRRFLVLPDAVLPLG